MKALTKASRVNSAIQVIQHMNNGMTVVDACKEVGLPRSSYYDIIAKHPEAIAEYQEMVEGNARQQLGLILAHKSEILHKVIEDGLSDDTSPRERLAIYKTLDELTGKLRNALQVESEAAKAAHEFLKQGPVTKLQKSRLTASQTTTLTIESEG
jgi:ACT domain-containing protein